MAETLWGGVRDLTGNLIDALGTTVRGPEMGWSEAVAGRKTLNTGNQPMASASQGGTPQPGYAPTPSNVAALGGGSVQGASSSQPSGGLFDQNGNQIGSSPDRRVVNNPTPQPTTQQTGRLAELQRQKDAGQLSGSAQFEYDELIRNSQGEQQDSAAAAAEARRRAAEARYNAQKGIAEESKGMAKREYDWLVETLGSNKKDALDQVMLNQEQGEADYATQEKKTRSDYDKAKQEILSTYRSLQVEQEKILRGSGMSSSSRSQEAALRLNQLLGKDMSTITTNEADSLAAIGNTLTYFQKQITLTKNSIETETKGKLDKAALDYDRQIKSIDANMTLSAAEREEAYAAAEIQLAEDSKAISQWATGLKMQAAELQAKNQGTIDNFVADMLDVNGSLNKDITAKNDLTNTALKAAGMTSLIENPTMQNQGVGVYQNAASYSSKDALDKALADGKIDQREYQTQLGRIQLNSSPTSGVVADRVNTRVAAAPTTSARGGVTQSDPLLAALFA